MNVPKFEYYNIILLVSNGWSPLEKAIARMVTVDCYETDVNNGSVERKDKGVESLGHGLEERGMIRLSSNGCEMESRQV